MLMVNVPATLGLIVLATPIVQLLFERGRFVPADTTATAAALQCYALGLVGYSAARIVSPVFYALGRAASRCSSASAAIVVERRPQPDARAGAGISGLALGTSWSRLANGAMLIWLLRRRLDGLGGVDCPSYSSKIAMRRDGDGGGGFSDSARHESRRTRQRHWRHKSCGSAISIGGGLTRPRRDGALFCALPNSPTPLAMVRPGYEKLLR